MILSGLSLVVALVLAPPPPPVLAPGTEDGDSLAVYLVTIGQGDAVWERFGHNAIGIRDRRRNVDVLFNWGLFDFQSPGFVRRFIRGEMMYWMAGSEAAPEIAGYIGRNRDVTFQELNLTHKQRIALVEFVSWNSREENKYYRYDYFRDNCSTRVRDALDRVLGGAIRSAVDTIVTPYSYRDQALRLTSPDLLTSTGIDLGLGRPSDHRLSGWEEMFIPMRVRDRLRAIRVADDSGRLVPLVASERVVYSARRAPEPQAPPNRAPFFLVVGAVLGALVLLSGRNTARTTVARTVLTVWAAIVGVVGVLVLFLMTATEHIWAYWNLNALAFSPLWLLLALAIPFAHGSAPSGRFARTCAVIAGGLTVVALLIACIPGWRQDSLAVVLLAAPANIAAATVTWRMLAAPTKERIAA